MIRSMVTISIAVVCLSGCSMAPRYTQPQAPVPATWPTSPAHKNSAARAGNPTAAELKWNQFVINPQLQKLITLALANNRDLRVAALNVEKSRAQYRIKRADILPTVSASGSGSVQRLPADVSVTGQSMISRNYNLSLGLSTYELDFFGRIQSLESQALEQYLATNQARRSFQISLISEVANNYLTLAADRERLTLALDTLENQQTSYRLVQRRFNAGASSELDLRQAFGPGGRGPLYHIGGPRRKPACTGCGHSRAG